MTMLNEYLTWANTIEDVIMTWIDPQAQSFRVSPTREYVMNHFATMLPIGLLYLSFVFFGTVRLFNMTIGQYLS